MYIETERLILRNARESDVAAYYEAWNSEFDLKYNGMNPPTMEQAASAIEKDAVSERALYIECKEDSRNIGAIHLEEDSLRHKVNSIMLEYYLIEPYARQGYMTEALRATLEYAFCTLGADIVSVRVFGDNEASLRLIEGLGFTREGMLRKAVKAYGDVVHDDVLFSMLREEYEAV